jgi:hypothetical protein
LTKCEDCGSRRLRQEFEDKISFVAYSVAVFCTGVLVSFAFIIDFGYEFMIEDGYQRYHMWVSYMSYGPMLIAMIGCASWIIVGLYALMLWLEGR